MSPVHVRKGGSEFEKIKILTLMLLNENQNLDVNVSE